MRKKKKYNYTKKTGRPPGEVGALAKREGITRQAAWYRLSRATGNPRGRPRRLQQATELTPAQVQDALQKCGYGIQFEELDELTKELNSFGASRRAPGG